MATPPNISIPQNNPQQGSSLQSIAQPGSQTTPQVAPLSSSLHDIKPIPDFYPLPIALICGLGLAILASLFYLYWRHIHNRPKPAQELPPDPPYTLALREIEYLTTARSQKTIGVRELALRLSLLLRAYLEGTFKFPAKEQTGQEVISDLRQELSTLRVSPPESIDSICKSINAVFRFVERAAFCEEPDVVYPLLGKHFDDVFSNIRKSVEELEQRSLAATYRDREAISEAIPQNSTREHFSGEEHKQTVDERV